jgi:hypothetical protein
MAENPLFPQKPSHGVRTKEGWSTASNEPSSQVLLDGIDTQTRSMPIPTMPVSTTDDTLETALFA